MKHTIVTFLAGLLLVASSHGQGTLFFSNKHGSVDAPVYFDFIGGQRINNSDFVAQLYAGASAVTLVPIGYPAPFRSVPSAGWGYWNPGVNSARTVPDVAPGQTAFAKIVVWDITKYPTYAAAVSGGGQANESALFSPKTGGDGVPPTLPQDLVGLTSFVILSLVPEPTVLALGAIGGLALLLHRRKS